MSNTEIIYSIASNNISYDDGGGFPSMRIRVMKEYKTEEEIQAMEKIQKDYSKLYGKALFSELHRKTTVEIF